MIRIRLLPTLMATAAVSLLFAMWTGLFRSGLPVPAGATYLPLAHGPLMICGFLGTVIALEKARGLDAWWGYLAPALSGAGALAMIAGIEPAAYRWAFFAASIVLLLISADLVRRHLDAATLLIVGGSAAWAVGNLLWMRGQSIPQVVSWWLAFPVLIIVGERLELTRVLPRSRVALAELFVDIGLYVAGLGLLYWKIDLAFRVQGLGLLLIALWLLRHDLARRTVRSEGVYRYTAICLLAGFAWLALSGMLLGIWGANLSALRYDAVLHGVLLGFAFGMIFGHAPIIAPMLLGRQLAFDRVMYAPLTLLQLSLLIRVPSSLADWLPGRTLGATLNVAAVLLFLAVAARAFRRGHPV